MYYWHCEVRSSNAEVDFLFLIHGKIIPIEVKSGTSGHLKSLHLFLESHPHSDYGIKISQQEQSDYGNIKGVPFYGVESLLHV